MESHFNFFLINSDILKLLFSAIKQNYKMPWGHSMVHRAAPVEGGGIA